MAKKSTAARSSSAARRPQTTAKNPARQAMLVRTPDMVAAGASSAPPNTSPSAMAVREPATRATTKPAASAATATGAVKPGAPVKAAAPATKPVARPAGSTSAPAGSARGTQASRMARAQAVQRARTVHLISAENYAYVVNDLKLTGILAASMFFIILVLHFILG